MTVTPAELAVVPRPDLDGLDRAPVSALALLCSILQASHDCLKLLTLEGRIIYANANALDALESGALDRVQDTIWSSYWPLDWRETMEDALEQAAFGRGLRLEMPRRAGDPQEKWWSVTLAPVFDDQGDIVSILAVSRQLGVRPAAD